MDMARSIFGRDHEGYVGREEHTVRYPVQPEKIAYRGN